jgi:autotransporter translocation and assembly factor TamB
MAALDARDVDLARLVRAAPSSSLSTHTEVGLRVRRAGELDGDYRIDVPGGRVAATSTPHLQTHGRLFQGQDGGLRIDGEATVDEAGARVEADYQLRARTGALLVHAELDGRLRDPPRLTALGVRASGTLSASADFDSKTNLVDARARLRLASVLHEAVRAQAVAVDAKIRGQASDPSVLLDLTAGPVDASGRRFEYVAATVSGKPSRLRVNALVKGASPERVELETEVSLARAVELERLRVTLLGPEGPVELAAQRVVAENGGLRIESFELRGAGSADGDIDVRPDRERFRFSATDLELGRIARVVGVRVPFERALVSADVALEHRRGALDGHVRARASDVRIGKLEGASASVDLAFTPRNISGTAEADFGEGGRLHVELDRFEPPREPWTLEKFANQPGSLVARGDFKLAGFLPLVEAAGLPIERVAGTAEFDISASGGAAGTGPRLEARVRTKGLRLVERRARHEPVRTAAQARELAPRALEGVDVKMLAEIEPTDRTARVDLELFDQYGTIVTLKGDTRLPVNWPATLRDSWRTLPLRARLEIPRRPFEIFPEIVRPSVTKGIASARVDFEGTVVEPRLDGEVTVDGLRARAEEEPVRLAMTTHYDRARGALTLAAESRGRSVATLKADWRGDAARLATTGVNGRSPIELDLAAELHDFPLDSIPALVDRQISGPLSGTIRLDDLGRDAKLEVSLDGSKMTIGEVRMQRLRAEVKAEQGRVSVHAEGGDRSGNAELELRTDVAWGDRLLPSVPTEADGRLVAHAFRLDTLSPAVKRYLNELGGLLDADLTVKLAPGKNALSGEASIRDGFVQVPAVGERFTDVTAKIRIEGDRVLVRNASARGPTGRLTARAAARLDGLELVSAEAHVKIAKSEKLPVTLQGAAVGDAWGNVAVLYRKTKDVTEIRVDVPSLHVELAEQGDLDVQSLDEIESIRIGARLADGTFTSLPVQPLEAGEDSESSSPMRVRVRLGRNVEIDRGRALKVKLGGEVVMTSDGESRMTGRLELRGGTLDVQGKLFDIERGLVTFAGDPSNPTITATARWDSPVGYSVYADYSGDVRNGKITLRSEPPLNQDEIASLLMFGDPEGSVGTGSGSTNSAATAVGVAGDTAAKGINKALTDLTRLDVAARVDTSTGTARPELVVQLSPRVAARVTRAVGEPQAGQPPDRTFLTVEFRFTRSWSVSGVVGDHGGSGLDVIWRRRY